MKKGSKDTKKLSIAPAAKKPTQAAATKSAASTKIRQDGPSKICYLTPDGEIVCEPATVPGGIPNKGAKEQALKAFIASHYGLANWGPNKRELALQLLEVLHATTLPDTPNIPLRSGQLVNTAKLLLQALPAKPPSMVLFNYSELPFNVVSSYLIGTAKTYNMYKIYPDFEKLSPS